MVFAVATKRGIIDNDNIPNTKKLPQILLQIYQVVTSQVSNKKSGFLPFQPFGFDFQILFG
jgi:hypothetical protein